MKLEDIDIEDEGGRLVALDGEGEEQGFISYYFGSFFGEECLVLDYAETYLEGRGIFSVLFGHFLNIGRERNCRKAVLEVAKENGRALEIYNHYNFNVDESIGVSGKNTFWMSRGI
jgi:hypothetical protein